MQLFKTSNFFIVLIILIVIAAAVYYVYFMKKLTFYNIGWMDKSMDQYKVHSEPRLTLFNSATGLNQSDIKNLRGEDVGDLTKLAKAVPVYLKYTNKTFDYNYMCVGSNGTFDLYNLPKDVKPKVDNIAINFVDGLVSAGVFSYKP
jgi:hypothetical protein